MLKCVPFWKNRPRALRCEIIIINASYQGDVFVRFMSEPRNNDLKTSLFRRWFSYTRSSYPNCITVFCFSYSFHREPGEALMSEHNNSSSFITITFYWHESFLFFITKQSVSRKRYSLRITFYRVSWPIRILFILIQFVFAPTLPSVLRFPRGTSTAGSAYYSAFFPPFLQLFTRSNRDITNFKEPWKMLGYVESSLHRCYVKIINQQNSFITKFKGKHSKIHFS